MTLFRWKEPLKEFLKTTIIGGASFLLPVAFVIFIMSYALRLVRRIAEPISHSLHLDHLVGAGVGTVTVLSVAVLVLISFAAGIVARTAAGRRITRWSENSFLGRLPHYVITLPDIGVGACGKNTTTQSFSSCSSRYPICQASSILTKTGFNPLAFSICPRPSAMLFITRYAGEPGPAA